MPPCFLGFGILAHAGFFIINSRTAVPTLRLSQVAVPKHLCLIAGSPVERTGRYWKPASSKTILTWKARLWSTLSGIGGSCFGRLGFPGRARAWHGQSFRFFSPQVLEKTHGICLDTQGHMVMVRFFAVPRQRSGVLDVPTGYATFVMPKMLGSCTASACFR